MPDISMCFGENCTKKEKCYRYRAKPDSYQAYAKFKQDENGNCAFFIKFNDLKKIKKQQ